MKRSTKIVSSSILVGLGFFMAHLVFESIREDDLRVVPLGLLFLIAVCLIGVSVGFFRVGTARLSGWAAGRIGRRRKLNEKDS